MSLVWVMPFEIWMMPHVVFSHVHWDVAVQSSYMCPLQYSCSSWAGHFEGTEASDGLNPMFLLLFQTVGLNDARMFNILDTQWAEWPVSFPHRHAWIIPRFAGHGPGSANR